MPGNDPLSYIPDLFYRPQNYGAQFSYGNVAPETAVLPTPAPPPPAPAPAPIPQIPQIMPTSAPGYTLRQEMSPEALGADPVLAISEIVRRRRLNDFWRTLLMSVVQVRPGGYGGR